MTRVPEARRQHDWGVRLADVRVPRWYWQAAVLLSLIAAWSSVHRQRAVSQALPKFHEGAMVLAERARAGDARSDHMAHLAERMDQMTRSMRRIAIASMAVSAVSVLVALVALLQS